MLFMTTLSKLSFQEKGHGLCIKKKKTCSRKHDDKRCWTHEGPKYSKNNNKKRVGHMKVHVFKEKKREKEIAHVQRKKWMER